MKHTVDSLAVASFYLTDEECKWVKHTVDSLAVASFYLTDEECKCTQPL